jgi:hypothetical protein
MLDYAKKIKDSMRSELDNLTLLSIRDDVSPQQRAALMENSIRQIQIYIIQLDTVMECLAGTRSSSPEIGPSTSIIIPVDYKLQYTGPRVGLIEIEYALAKMGVFNNGQVGIGMINSYFEKVFFTNNVNYTSTFQDICGRKRENNTKFIDSMATALNDWIEKH